MRVPEQVAATRWQHRGLPLHRLRSLWQKNYARFTAPIRLSVGHRSELSGMEFSSLLTRFALAPLPVPASWYAVPLRLIVGFGFVEHGYAKLARGADEFIAILHAIGMPFADLLGWATIIVEIVGGLLIFAGAFVPVATVAMIVVLLVAIFTVHLPNGFSSIKLMSYDAAGAHFGQPGYETDLLYIAGLLALWVGGAGPLSLDSYLKGRPVL
jgi:putative oxidoreductase